MLDELKHVGIGATSFCLTSPRLALHHDLANVACPTEKRLALDKTISNSFQITKAKNLKTSSHTPLQNDCKIGTKKQASCT
jgi:hypothetical protein